MFLININKEIILGILLCILTAIISINISDIIGKVLFGLEKSPLSPIIIAIIIGTILSNLKNTLFLTLKPGYDFFIKRLLKFGKVII